MTTEIFIVLRVCVFFCSSFRCFSNPIYTDVGISWLAFIFHGMFPGAVCQSRANFCLENITIVSRLVLLKFLIVISHFINKQFHGLIVNPHLLTIRSLFFFCFLCVCVENIPTITRLVLHFQIYISFLLVN